MRDNVECPFCGIEILTGGTHPQHPVCELSGYNLSSTQWNLRPPKTGQPAQTWTSELDYLRSLLRELLINGKTK